MAERTRQAIALGNSVVDMTLGEPDFPTPEHIGEAAIRAIKAGQTKYTPINGTRQLREAIVAKFSRENGIHCTVDSISVGCGGKQVIYQAFLATLCAGDEVLVPAPYWASYGDIVMMNGGVLRPLATSPGDGYALKPGTLAQALTSKAKWLVLNSPSNPSGTAYTAAELQAFADVIRASRNEELLIMVDDIYEHILYDGREFKSFAQIAPDLADRVLTVNGVSKAYSMTGWRLGYACGPQALIDAMTKVQMQVNSHTSSISQAAAVAALTGPQEEVHRRRGIFERRRDFLLERFSGIEGLQVPKPGGAFYLFPDARRYLGSRTPSGAIVADDVALASYLLDCGIALVPGSGFGMPGFLRLSYATSDENLQVAAERMKNALENLQHI
jgi:aspartate aminotransferase